jgi:hypothetical protein
VLLIERFQIKEKSPFNRVHLLGLRTDQRLKARTHLVYIYELGEAEQPVNYPCGLGRILYIGEACRQTLPSGGRFGQHVSASLSGGNDPGSNFALSQYYHRGVVLVLTVYEVSDQQRKQREKDLLIWHLRTFGALPIAQGSSGENFTIVAVRDHPAQVPREVIDRHFRHSERQEAVRSNTD